MHDLVKAGLEIMRDPNTPQIEGTLHTSEGFCALGCIAEAAVRAGCTKWSGGTAINGIVVFNYDKGDTPTSEGLPVCIREVYDDLTANGPGLDAITDMNDMAHAPLSEIADFIEAAYAERANQSAEKELVFA